MQQNGCPNPILWGYVNHGILQTVHDLLHEEMGYNKANSGDGEYSYYLSKKDSVLNKNGDYRKMVVVYPYYGHVLTMAICKLYTVYYTDK